MYMPITYPSQQTPKLIIDGKKIENITYEPLELADEHFQKVQALRIYEWFVNHLSHGIFHNLLKIMVERKQNDVEKILEEIQKVCL